MRTLLVSMTLLVMAVTVGAELQNVAVGGQLRVRGRWWHNTYYGTTAGPAVNRYLVSIPGRALGPGGFASRYDFDDRGNDWSFVEQKTQLFVDADFTNNVKARVRLESYERWGEDFRSNYITGQDARAVTADDLEILDAYIDVTEIYGIPLALRIGRQPLKFGKGFLVWDVSAATLSRPYDAVRLTYTPDNFVIDAWWSKLAETSPAEQDGDTDFWGVYGTYTGWEPADIALYAMYVRDGGSFKDTQYGLFWEAAEDWLGVDDYDTVGIVTVGTRINGKTGALDYDLELAYQFGDAGRIGGLFVRNVYGDDDASFDTWAGDLQVGYTLDQVPWQPRVFVAGAYYGGEDNRDVSFLEWLNPFRGGVDALPFWEAFSPYGRPQASLSFNRLFTGVQYSQLFEIQKELSNFWTAKVGLTAHPREKFTLDASLSYFVALEEADLPPAIQLGRFRFPYLAPFSFIDYEADNELGWQTTLALRYDYSDDLFVTIGWEHLFTGPGFDDGNFVSQNGLQFMGGSDDDDADYIYIDTGITF